ncbi:MAG: SCO family protein [Methylotenera sp.]
METERKANLFLTKPEVLLNLINEQGQVVTLSAFAKQQNKILVTEFIYTRCRTLCLTLGDYFQQAQTQIKTQALDQKIHLLSISFDIKQDSPERLKSYRKRMRADESIWSLATMQSDADLIKSKDDLGLVVLETQFKEFVHNSAFLVISNHGKLLGIYDDDDIQGALTLAAKQSQQL